MTTLCLVGCSKTKLLHAAPAQDLYTSPLFRLGRAWAEQHADHWAILSARYGVLLPDRVIEPYDTTIAEHSPYGRARLSPAEYATWLYASVQAWRCRYATGPTQGPRLIVLAGREYWAPLVERSLPLAVELPLEGLGIGERLKWLRRETQAPTFQWEAPS